MEMTMLIISVLLAVSFVGTAIWREKALPESISAMAYVFDGSWKWLWSVWLWLVIIFLAPSLIEALDSRWQFVGFMTVALIAFVGAMPLFDVENKKWHYILGIAACILSQICVLIICPWWLFLWFALPAAAYFGKEVEWLDGKGVFLSECICALTLYCSVLIHNI